MSELGADNVSPRSVGSRQRQSRVDLLREEVIAANARLDEQALLQRTGIQEIMALLRGRVPEPRAREDRTSLLSDDATAGAFATPLQGAATAESTAGQDDATTEAAVRRLTAGYVLPPAPLVPPLDLPQRSLKREARITGEPSAASSESSDPIAVPELDPIDKPLSTGYASRFSVLPPPTRKVPSTQAPLIAVSHHEKIDFERHGALLKHATHEAILEWLPAFKAYHDQSPHLHDRDGWSLAAAVSPDVQGQSFTSLLKTRTIYTTAEVFELKERWLSLSDAKVYTVLQHALAATSAEDWFKQITPALHLTFADLCASAKPNKKQPVLRTTTYEYFFMSVKLFHKKLLDMIDIASPECVRTSHWYPKFWVKNPEVRTLVSTYWQVWRDTPSVDLHVAWFLQQEQFKTESMRNTGTLEAFLKKLLL